MRKFHKLLHGVASLYDEIVPTAVQKTTLIHAKNKIRDHLRASVRTASVRDLKMDKPVEPRFRTQGSWAYASCVQPAHTPPQEMDWDYGVYLPVDHLDSAGTPRVAAAAYFQLVELLLTQLSQRERWTMGEPKNHCIRVHIGHEAHIDVALYAAPANEFLKVNDRAMEARAYTADSAISMEQLNEASEITEDQSWDDFDGMMVATRDGVWESSDAEHIAGWFREQRKIHGEQIQRIWRYLKSWRDQQWLEGGPSSVALMLIACRHFDPVYGRDDKALFNVSRHLPAALMADIYEDGIDPDHNFNRLAPHDREVARYRAQALTDGLKKALTDVMQPKSTLISGLRHFWGPRLPDRESDTQS